MRSQGMSSVESGLWARSHVRRKVRPCVGCGAPITRTSHDISTGFFCSACVERPDDPVTAEHYYDLGGNE